VPTDYFTKKGIFAVNNSPLNLPVFFEDSFSPILSNDGSISADRRIFEVRPTSRQCRILRELASRKSGILPRHELIGAMYGDQLEDHAQTSLRSTANRYQTAVKTISRIRIALEKFFGDLTPPGFDWLPWNEKLGGWILFQRSAVDQARA
jgi:hypothetical protein